MVRSKLSIPMFEKERPPNKTAGHDSEASIQQAIPSGFDRGAIVEYRGEKWIVRAEPSGDGGEKWIVRAEPSGDGEVKIWKKTRGSRVVSVDDVEPVPLPEDPVDAGWFQ